jgi:hypothetical protein
MRPLAAEDAGRFHGREAEITELIGRLRTGSRWRAGPTPPCSGSTPRRPTSLAGS